jgi:fibronectin type 3 domain-containing protein
VNLIVTSPAPSAPASLSAAGTNLLINLRWLSSPNADSYNLKRSTTTVGPYGIIANVSVTNYADPAVNPGVTYFYVVTATNSSGESAESMQASAVPLPSSGSTNLSFQVTPGGLQLAWPADHQGWRLEVQTNSLATGLSANWFTVPGSGETNQMALPISAGDHSVFYRLAYP